MVRPLKLIEPPPGRIVVRVTERLADGTTSTSEYLYATWRSAKRDILRLARSDVAIEYGRESTRSPVLRSEWLR